MAKKKMMKTKSKKGGKTIKDEKMYAGALKGGKGR